MNKCPIEEYISGDVKLLPISYILETPYFKTGDKNSCLTQLCYVVVERTLQALCKKKYTCFDAHTTTNCCHGMAILVHTLISGCKDFDLKRMLKEIDMHRNKFGKFVDFDKHLFPEQILSLSSLYILNYAVETKLGVGRRTKAKKLKELSEIGTNLCCQIVRGLQKKYSNVVCDSYASIFNNMPFPISTCGVSTEKWAKYIVGKYLKTDRHGFRYASCTYSMQVVLAHLITTFAKIAVINDVQYENKTTKRNVYILQGDGKQNFHILNQNVINKLEKWPKTDPIIVFGGCSINEIKADGLSIEHWLLNFPALVLACDIFYPEFPSVRDDLLFDSSPIDQKDSEILRVFNQYSKVLGVFSENPTLFCLTHIHTASLQQILDELREDNLPILPKYFIPYAITARQSQEFIQTANN